MYSENIIDGIKKYQPVKLSVTKIPDELKLKEQILEETKFLPNDYKLSIRYFCIENNILEIPKCICGNNCIPNKLNNRLGFTQYCSTDCSRKNKTNKISRESDYKSKLQNYDWLYEQRIILQKSVEQIAIDLGCSAAPVRKAIRQLEIPLVKYNEANPLVGSYLRNKEWLYNKHKIERKTCLEIAKELEEKSDSNVSKGFVSVWLEKHQIEANENNSYDRPFSVISKPQQEIIDYIKTIYSGEISINNRSVIGKELDIYLPEYNLAIEYNGEYSHRYKPDEENSNLRKGRDYHVNKTNLCETKNIQLFHIFGWSWKNKKDIWKSIIANKLGLSRKIYARNCQIKEITNSEKGLFLEHNHLQGKDLSKWKYGLFYKDELVSVMTFGKPRYNKKYDYELIRFSSKIGYSIVGGFSKLLYHFRKQFNGSIITYADRSYSNGNVYGKNGFSLISINAPGYWYTYKNDEKPLNRFNYRKSQISQPDDKRTEEEIMLSNGYHKTFDCGSKTYVLE